MEIEAFFAGWGSAVRVVTTCVLGYAGVVALVRISGKRTLAQLNAFDWIVTVAFGSMLATTVLSDEVALVDGLAAFVTLAALQFAVTFVSTRVAIAERLVKNEAALLVHRGRFLPDALRRERISEEEILQALRAAGVPSTTELEAVVLETNGEVSVLRMAAGGSGDALERLVDRVDDSGGG